MHRRDDGSGRHGLEGATIFNAHVGLRAAIPGFVHLEAQSALGHDVDADVSFRAYVDLLVHGLSALAIETGSTTG